MDANFYKNIADKFNSNRFSVNDGTESVMSSILYASERGEYTTKISKSAFKAKFNDDGNILSEVIKMLENNGFKIKHTDSYFIIEWK